MSSRGADASGLIVLDASAVLAHAREEPGWQTIERRLRGSLISAVNYSEVLKKSVERGGTSAAAAILLARNGVGVVTFDAAHGRLAADLWAATKPLGLSFADRACLALAVAVAGTVYTTDRQMAKADLPVSVVLVREGH